MRTSFKDAEDGAPDVILIGTGSEVQYAVAAQQMLAAEGIKARVVSMPCREWFDEQDQDYRDSVIPPDVKARVSVEAGVALGWRDLVGDAGRIISIDHYGASAAAGKLFAEFGFTAETVAAAARESIETATKPGEPPAPAHPAASGPKATGGPGSPSRASRSADASVSTPAATAHPRRLIP